MKVLLLFLLIGTLPLRAITVSGDVQAIGGARLAGVAVTLEQVGGEMPPWHATTDATGHWSVSDPLLFGNLLVTPADPDYTFDPVNRSYFTFSDLAGVNFTAKSRGDLVLLNAWGVELPSGTTIDLDSTPGQAVPLKIRVKNRGPRRLRGIRAVVGGTAGVFSLDAAPPTELLAGEEQTVQLLCRPREPGSFHGELNFFSEDSEPRPYTLAVTLASEALPTPAATLAGEELTLSWPATPGTAWRVEASADMQTWQPVGESVIGLGPPAEMTVALPLAARAFFRLQRRLPGPTLSATFFAADGLLILRGSADRDDLTLDLTGAGEIRIGGGAISIEGGPATLANTKRVLVLCGDGNDVLDTQAVPLPVVAFGGGGNDRLTTGAGDDWLNGDAGDDTINGGPGFNRLYGGAGINGFQQFSDGRGGFIDGGEAGIVALYGSDGADRIVLSRAPDRLAAIVGFQPQGASLECVNTPVFFVQPEGRADTVVVDAALGAVTPYVIVDLHPTLDAAVDGGDMVRVEGTPGNDSMKAVAGSNQHVVVGVTTPDASLTLELLNTLPADDLLWLKGGPGDDDLQFGAEVPPLIGVVVEP